jgi:hypothetical protein|tara:strand:+ start:319 stop:447 length:129 start_codon:yes stop_codon:yes gene_type:complete
MNNYEDMLERGPTWVWAYAETQGMEIKRTFKLKDYEPIGEKI